MEVNRQWWDGTERYINNSDAIDAEHVITTIGDLSTDIPLNPTKYIGVEWDKTICPWKINYKSDFFNPQWCLPYNQSGGSFKMVQAPFFKQRKKGYTFYISAAGGTASYQPHEVLSYYAATKPCWVNLLSRSDIDITQNPSQQWVYEKYYKTFPVVNFDYSKLFCVPMIHIENGNGYLFRDTAQAREDWDAESVYGVSLMFYAKTPEDTSDLISVGIHSLNNEIAPPPWDTTNCWTDDKMFDNGLALTHWNAWDGGYEIGGIQTLGTECTWSDSGASAGDPGFTDTEYPSDNVAGAILYYPAKNIMIQMPADSDDETLWGDWTPYYKGGSHEYSVRRHLKSTVTFDQFASYLKKQLAYLGFRFCVDAERLNDSIDSQYYFIPEIDENGVTTGNYYAANSTEAQSLPNNNWTNDVYENTPYDGTDDEEDDDPNDYDDSNTTILNPIASEYGNEFQNAYVLSLTAGGGAASLADVAAFLYSTAPTNSCLDDYLSSNPIDAVISCIMYPFRVNTQVPTTGLPFVRFGKVTSELKALGYIQSQIQIIDCGECVYYPEYGVDDFRSYEPYCDAELILPYCGSVKISPTAIYCKTTQQNFHKIKVKYIVDLSSGACLACVFLDNLLIDTVNGQIGMTVPVTGVRSSDLQRDIFHKQTGLKQAANSGLSAIASAIFGTATSGGGVGTAQALVNGALNIDSAATNYKAAEYELNHVQIPYSVRASASPLTDFANEQFPRLIIKRPVMLDYTPEIYAHSVGYACLITAEKMSDYGDAANPQYIECTGLDFTGFAGTETEKARLKNALEGGIYL